MRYISKFRLLCSVYFHQCCLQECSCFICVICVTVYNVVLHDFTIGETWRVYYKWKELLNLREPMSSPWSLFGVCCLLFQTSVLCCALFFFVLCIELSMLSVSLDCQLLISNVYFFKKKTPIAHYRNSSEIQQKNRSNM